MTHYTGGHAKDCDYHLDQYPHECTCGVSVAPAPDRSMTPELEALAGRVEALAGPDREVDVHISLLISGVTFTDTDVADMLRVRDEPTGYGRYRPADERVPRYTASLDAAMTLIEPDEYWRLGNDGEGPDVAMFKATATSHDNQADLHFHDAVAATPALALVAAALRASTPTQNHKGQHDES